MPLFVPPSPLLSNLVQLLLDGKDREVASIRQRGEVFQARVIRKGHPPYTKSFPTHGAAITWGEAIEAMLAAGMSPRPNDPNVASRSPSPLSGISLADALERYGREVTPSKRGSPQELRRIRSLAARPIATKRLEQVRGVDIAQYRDLRLATVGPNTVRLELALLSHLFEIARREWGFDRMGNPVKAIRKPKAPRGRTRRASPEELERLLPHCSKKLRAIVTVALETGMRRSELVALRWGDLDIGKRVALLHTTKNGDPRAIPLSTRALTAIQALVDESPPKAIERVFGFATADAITRAFRQACAAARISGLRFHDLRHEAVSRLFERGLSLPEVAAISGHKTWAMLKRYTHLSAEALVAKLG